jgi:hypothetical protein
MNGLKVFSISTDKIIMLYFFIVVMVELAQVMNRH